MIYDKNKDLRSNLNTSCASSFLSSSNTTFSQICPNRAIQKINELKGLYYETVREQSALAQEKKILLVQLSNLKEELSHLIEDKYSGHRKPKTESRQTAEKDKLYRVGCISKINKGRVDKHEIREKKDEGSGRCKISSKQREDYWQKRERKTIQKQKIYNLDRENKKNSGHRKSQTNIYQQLRKDIQIPRKTSLRKYQHKEVGQEVYSTVAKQRSQRLKQLQEKDESYNLDVQFKRKSYLNSPRSSLLSSPRLINKMRN